MVNKSESKLEPPVVISPDSLSPETFNAVLESFVLREGTDYGVHELSLEQKIKNLRRKVESKEFVLVFDPNTESLNFLTKQEFQKVKIS